MRTAQHSAVCSTIKLVGLLWKWSCVKACFTLNPRVCRFNTQTLHSYLVIKSYCIEADHGGTSLCVKVRKRTISSSRQSPRDQRNPSCRLWSECLRPQRRSPPMQNTFMSCLKRSCWHFGSWNVHLCRMTVRTLTQNTPSVARISCGETWSGNVCRQVGRPLHRSTDTLVLFVDQSIWACVWH